VFVVFNDPQDKSFHRFFYHYENEHTGIPKTNIICARNDHEQINGVM